MIRIHLETGPRKVVETNAGTGEGTSARIHVANSHGDRAEEGRSLRSDRRRSANSLWEKVESCVTLVIGVVVVKLCLAAEKWRAQS